MLKNKQACTVEGMLESAANFGNKELNDMFAGLLNRNSAPLLDEETIQWQFDTFAWALKQFNEHVFRNETTLVLPDNSHFPGQESSVHGIANLMFTHVKKYTGVAHWPTRLLEQDVCPSLESPRVQIEGALRGSGGIVAESVPPENQLVVTYEPSMVSNPEGLIASFAHTVAHYLGTMASEEAPGGRENWPHTTELLAVFMGFGVIFANSAYNFRAGCGSCAARGSERENYLSQHDITYALAIFTVLKSIPPRQVSRHLKKTLRSYFAQAVKDVQGRTDELGGLQGKALPGFGG